jgi:hypothetical protein
MMVSASFSSLNADLTTLESVHFPLSLSYIYNIKQEIPKQLYEKLKYEYFAILNLMKRQSSLSFVDSSVSFHLERSENHDEETTDVPVAEFENGISGVSSLSRSSSSSSSVYSFVIIHQLSRLFKKSIIDEQILFPTSFLGQFCAYCDCIQFLGITSSMKLQRRKKHSKINKKTKQKMKNEIVRSFSPSFRFTLNFWFVCYCLFLWVSSLFHFLSVLCCVYSIFIAFLRILSTPSILLFLYFAVYLNICLSLSFLFLVS